MNVLFVCSRNIWRSRTAETIFRDHHSFQVRSAGTSDSARVKLSLKHLVWADLVFVMENKHRKMIRQKFGTGFEAEVIVLDIPDEYQYMDEELILSLKSGVAPYLNTDH